MGTRDRIVDVLKYHTLVTIDGLAERTKLDEATIRRHLHEQGIRVFTRAGIEWCEGWAPARRMRRDPKDLTA